MKLMVFKHLDRYWSFWRVLRSESECYWSAQIFSDWKQNQKKVRVEESICSPNIVEWWTTKLKTFLTGSIWWPQGNCHYALWVPKHVRYIHVTIQHNNPAFIFVSVRKKIEPQSEVVSIIVHVWMTQCALGRKRRKLQFHCLTTKSDAIF